MAGGEKRKLKIISGVEQPGKEKWDDVKDEDPTAKKSKITHTRGVPNKDYLNTVPGKGSLQTLQDHKANIARPIQPAGLRKPTPSGLEQATAEDPYYQKYFGQNYRDFNDLVFSPMHEFIRGTFDVEAAQKRAEREERVAKIQAITHSMRSVADLFMPAIAGMGGASGENILVTPHDQSAVLRSIEQYREALNNVDVVKSQREAAMLENGIRALSLWGNVKSAEMQEEAAKQRGKEHTEVLEQREKELKNLLDKQTIEEQYRAGRDEKIDKRYDDEIEHKALLEKDASNQAWAKIEIDKTKANTSANRQKISDLIRTERYEKLISEKEGKASGGIFFSLPTEDGGSIPMSKAQYMDVLARAASHQAIENDSFIYEYNDKAGLSEDATDYIVTKYTPNFYYEDGGKLIPISKTGYVQKAPLNIDTDTEKIIGLTDEIFSSQKGEAAIKAAAGVFNRDERVKGANMGMEFATKAKADYDARMKVKTNQNTKAEAAKPYVISDETQEGINLLLRNQGNLSDSTVIKSIEQILKDAGAKDGGFTGGIEVQARKIFNDYQTQERFIKASSKIFSNTSKKKEDQIDEVAKLYKQIYEYSEADALKAAQEDYVLFNEDK